MRFGAVVLAVFTALVAFAAAGCATTGRANSRPASRPQWSRPVAISGVRSLTAVSCPRESFCVAVGGGQAVSDTAGRWSKPTRIDRYASAKVGLTTVSCPSTRFCVAGDSAGHAFRFDGSRWSGPALAGSGAYELEAGRWAAAGSLATSTPAGGSEPDTLSAVSCSSSTACAALDDFGDAFTWTHARWSAPFRFDVNLEDQSDAVSCPTAVFCMAVDSADVASSSATGRWSKPTSVADGGASLNDVSCVSAGFCIAVDSRGRALSYRSP